MNDKKEISGCIFWVIFLALVGGLVQTKSAILSFDEVLLGTLVGGVIGGVLGFVFRAIKKTNKT